MRRIKRTEGMLILLFIVLMMGIYFASCTKELDIDEETFDREVSTTLKEVKKKS